MDISKSRSRTESRRNTETLVRPTAERTVAGRTLGDTSPKPIGSPTEAYRTVLETLEVLQAKTVLDCPAGEGAFTRRLIDAGYEVSCCDILPDQFKLKEVSCEFCDLNSSVPFRDDQFDVVTCLNGLHRVWARGRAMKEMARVLRPGGNLILTFVNNTNLLHRFTFMATGSSTYNTLGPPHVCLPEAEDPAMYHRYPMTVGEVASAIDSVGLKLSCLRRIRISRASLLLAPLASIVWLLRPLAPRNYKKFCQLGVASNAAVLFGDYLLVIATKLDCRPFPPDEDSCIPPRSRNTHVESETT